jgi:hypothetical protein
MAKMPTVYANKYFGNLVSEKRKKREDKVSE